MEAGRMVMRMRPRRGLRAGLLAVLAAGIVPGCAMVPRERIEESQRLTRSLRTENGRLKDQVVALQTQNQDYADRALDDLRRLTARDEAIERLQQSVHGYQDDRDRLASAYQRLAVSLGRTSEDSAVDPTADRGRSPGAATGSPSGEPRSENLTSKDDGDASVVPSRATVDGSGP
jgi:hypothetical protein